MFFIKDMQKHNHVNLQQDLQKELHRDILSLKVIAMTKLKLILMWRNLDDIITSQEKFQVHLFSAAHKILAVSKCKPPTLKRTPSYRDLNDTMHKVWAR